MKRVKYNDSGSGRRKRRTRAQSDTGNIKSFSDGYWTWLINPDSTVSEITGKYLFFSRDRRALLVLGKLLLTKYGLPQAKTRSPGGNISEDYVLCVYDKEPRLKMELRKHADETNIRYRYWKSDVDTNRGKYSPQFLKALGDRLGTR